MFFFQGCLLKFVTQLYLLLWNLRYMAYNYICLILTYMQYINDLGYWYCFVEYYKIIMSLQYSYLFISVSSKILQSYSPYTPCYPCYQFYSISYMKRPCNKNWESCHNGSMAHSIHKFQVSKPVHKQYLMSRAYLLICLASLVGILSESQW